MDIEEKNISSLGINNKKYIESLAKVIESDSRFKHVMAIALDSETAYRDGIIRCIMNRKGNVDAHGYVDRSILYKVHGDTLYNFKITDKLCIKNQQEIINQIGGEDWDFLGLEDPDIWHDEKKNIMHVYFTMAFKNKLKDEMIICLGHAEGKDADTLTMTMPVLIDTEKMASVKELSIAPLNKEGFRHNLIESSDIIDGVYYSTVRTAIVKDMGKEWKLGKTIFHPKEYNISWIGGHASPGPLLPKSFIDLGEGKSLGFMNGREANMNVDGRIKYGVFSVGLFVYDYENGRIEWVSPEPLVRDSQAKTITFASQFIQTSPGEGILYAHVDDSFVRAYKINDIELKSLLPW